MEPETAKRYQATAFRTIAVCLISLVLGVAIVSMMFAKGGPEALGAIIPMSIVGLIHLIGIPVALLNAVKGGQRKAILYVLAYFVAFVIVSFQFAHPEIVGFHFFILVVTAITLGVHFIKAFLEKRQSRGDPPPL